MSMSYIFNFEGGSVNKSSSNDITASIKFHLFGIVGGKEVPLYSLLKSGLVKPDAKQELKPSEIFGQAQGNTTTGWYDSTCTSRWLLTDIRYWKIFTGMSASIGMKKTSHSIYIELADDPKLPVVKIFSLLGTPYIAALESLKFSVAMLPAHMGFISRFKFVNRNQLPDILDETALGWAKRVFPPPIPLLKEMVSVEENSRVVPKKRMIYTRKKG